MSDAPFMPKATAVWLVENTTLSFKQIASFCNLHELEIKGIADGNGDFSKSLNILVDKTKNFMGMRCIRFALISIDYNIEKLFIEKTGEFKVSSAEYILKHI